MDTVAGRCTCSKCKYGTEKGDLTVTGRNTNGRRKIGCWRRILGLVLVVFPPFARGKRETFLPAGLMSPATKNRAGNLPGCFRLPRSGCLEQNPPCLPRLARRDRAQRPGSPGPGHGDLRVGAPGAVEGEKAEQWPKKTFRGGRPPPPCSLPE